RMEADDGADQGSPICRGRAELHAAIHLHVRSGKRAPADVFILTFIRDLSVPVDATAHGTERRPAGTLVVDYGDRVNALHETWEIVDVPPEAVGLLRRAINQDAGPGSGFALFGQAMGAQIGESAATGRHSNAEGRTSCETIDGEGPTADQRTPALGCHVPAPLGATPNANTFS